MELKYFKDINLDDPFFDSLKADYPEFEEWFLKKRDKQAFVDYDGANIVGFLYLKKEDDEITDVEPKLPAKERLKVGTFKIDARGTKRGERFIKKIMDAALGTNRKEIYVTIYSKHKALIQLLMKYGFTQIGIKNHKEGEPELVLLKDLRSHNGDILKSYPLIDTSSNKYVLSILPQFHTPLFPDAILKTEILSEAALIKDVAHTNSIHKIYISKMSGLERLIRGDILYIYRTKERNDPTPAFYKSVVTSIAVVEDVRCMKSFNNIDQYLEYVGKNSIFDERSLRVLFEDKDMVVIKMLYNLSLKKRVINGQLINDAGIGVRYWGFFQIDDAQFECIKRLGQANENYFID